MNLIEQQNVLKGLTDEALQQALSSPSATPPYLIATEMARRKDMRQRYEGEQARRGKQSTVIEDLLAANPGPTAMPQQGGLPSMAPQMPPAMPPAQSGGISAFADGGLVSGGGGLDYAALSDRYLQSVNARPEREKRAQALALLMAGAGIIGGGSSNTLTNIGKGIAAGSSYYADALNNIDTEERAALRDAVDLERIRQADDLQRMEFDYRRSSDAEDRALRREELATGRKPASVVEAEWYQNATPEERATYDKINAPGLRPADIPKVIDDTFESALKAVPAVDAMTLARQLGRMATQEDIAAAEQQRYRQAELITYQRLRNAYGDAVASEYAARVGIDPNDALTETISTTTTSTPGGGAISYTDYFTD